MIIRLQHVIRYSLGFCIVLTLFISIGAHYKAKHIHETFLEHDPSQLQQVSGTLLGNETAIQLYQKNLAPYNLNSLGKTQFLVGFFSLNQNRIQTVWCDRWLDSPFKTASYTGPKNPIKQMNLPIRYFHTCQWLFDAMRLTLDIPAWRGQSITYLKSPHDILYAPHVNGKMIFGYEQAYQQYNQLYLDEIKNRNQSALYFFVFFCITVFHYRKHIFNVIKSHEQHGLKIK